MMKEAIVFQTARFLSKVFPEGVEVSKIVSEKLKTLASYNKYYRVRPNENYVNRPLEEYTDGESENPIIKRERFCKFIFFIN